MNNELMLELSCLCIYGIMVFKLYCILHDYSISFFKGEKNSSKLIHVIINNHFL